MGQTRHLLYDSAGRPTGGWVPLEDYSRLELLDERQADREQALRRGAGWELWEEDLLRRDDLNNEVLATVMKRTEKSVAERRRWIRRLDREAGR